MAVSGGNRCCLNGPDIAPTTLGLRVKVPRGRREGLFEVPGAGGATGHADSVTKPYRAIVTRDGWKYTCFGGISWMVFNLNEDPFEQVNLAHNRKYRAERGRLIGWLKQWVADSGDRFGVPVD